MVVEFENPILTTDKKKSCTIQDFDSCVESRPLLVNRYIIAEC